MVAPTERFFAEIPPVTSFSEVPRFERYAKAPEDWLVVITDVEGSTKAIEEGRYKDVNALGVASIVAIRNSMPDVDIPFVFGGDGATLLVPDTRRADVECALRGLRKRSAQAFGLRMRAGVVPIAELHASGHEVWVARFAASRHATFAMFAGSGLPEAERWIKSPDAGARFRVIDEGPTEVDFTGFECRWKPIPSRRGAVVSLLVHAVGDSSGAASTYDRVIAEIDRILAGADARPMAIETLSIADDTRAFEQEARIRIDSAGGFLRRLWQWIVRVQTMLGRFLIATNLRLPVFDGASYRQEVMENTDFRKFDDTLRMVLDLTEAERSAVRAALDAEHAAGRLVYGMHTAEAALMTCAIGAYRGNHLHFVDGADGGYALAAKELKRQLSMPPKEES